MGGESGIIYDLVLFQDANIELDEMTKNNLGFGGAVVMKLTEHVEPQNHFLYFNNYFSSYYLFHALEKERIYAVGTVLVNRYEKHPLLSDKEMAKLGRGSSFEIRSSVPNSKVGLLKWFDNKAVAMGSNFDISGIPDVVQRWNKKEKCYVEVDRPEIIRRYNKSMGGVDKQDMLISFFRTFIRSKKWTLHMVTHSFDMACRGLEN